MPKIQISLRLCNNLQSSRSDNFTCFSRVEFGQRLLGDSPRVEVKRGENLDFNFTTHINCSGSQNLDDIACNPVLVSVLEVLPKDKKAKEEKTNVLGQTCVDLLPLLNGEDRLQLNQKLHCSNSSVLVNTQGTVEEDLPELNIEVSVPEPILSEEQLQNSNIFSIRVRSLYSIPESWHISSSPSFTYTLALPLQNSKSSNRSIVIPNGLLLAPSDASYHSTNWRWLNLPSAMGEAINIPEKSVKLCSLQEENGVLNTPEDENFRTVSQHQKPCVAWNVERRCWLSPEANAALLNQLSKCAVWPVEVGRYSVPSAGGKGKVKEEDPVLSYHGVSYLNFAPLLYPGVNLIVGAFFVHPFNESDISEKTQFPHIYHSLLQENTPAVGRPPTGMKKAAVKKMASSLRMGESGSQADFHAEAQIQETKSEAHAYLDSKSYLYVEIEFQNPLIPKRPTSILAQRISEYIPPRSPLPKTLGGTERAISEFHSKTASITNILLQQYRGLFGEELLKNELSYSKEATDERRHKLLFHLNSTGTYHAFKEQLKQAVVQIVREKYLDRIECKTEDELHQLLSELYTFLTDHMHQGLKKVLALDDPAPPPPNALDCNMMKNFATEAEGREDYDLADYYYKECIARESHVASHWYDYGVFCLLIRDLDKSEQCFKEAVSLDQKFVPALLLYGMICCLGERYSEAEEFFEMATTMDATNVIAWTMRGLYYEHAANVIYRDMCYNEACKLNLGETEAIYIVGPSKTTAPQQPTAMAQSKASIASKQMGAHQAHELAVPFQVDGIKSGVNGLHNMEESGELAESVTSVHVSTVALDKHSEEVQESNETNDPGDQPTKQLENSSTSSIKSALSVQKEMGDGGAVGHKQEAGESLKESAFLQTASYLLDVHALKFAEMALAHELTSLSRGLNRGYLVAQARLHLEKKEIQNAKNCLQKAITFNFQDSVAWSLLGHCCYLEGDMDSAKDAYERTISYVNPPPLPLLHAVYIRLAEIYLKCNDYEKAKEMYLHACRKNPSSVTWKGVGIACFKLGDLAQAEDALCEANVLNNLDPVVWGYLAMICVKTQRPVEGEQALKFALKVGLRDKEIITELDKDMKLSGDIKTNSY